jgi:FMN phosphatase YigB (HAD superfamily)
MEDYQQEGWVSLYQSALIELDEAKMSERIKAACEAIVARMEKLSTLAEPYPAERQAIEESKMRYAVCALWNKSTHVLRQKANALQWRISRKTYALAL